MDDEWLGVEDVEDENDNDFTSRESWSGRDSLIFLIDCTEDMMVKMEDGDGDSAFALAVKCVTTVLKSKIISSERDMLGVVLFGTEKETDPNFKHIYCFQDLQQPGAESILALNKLFNSSREDFAIKYGHSSNYSLSDALWVCTSLFSKCFTSSMKIASRRILLFTNDDNPHKNNVQLQRQAFQKASDLIENSIELELLHMNKNVDNKFDVNRFYKNLLLLSSDSEEAGLSLEDPSEKFDELLTRVRTKDHKQRTVGRIPFRLPGEVVLSVAIYNLVLPLKKTYPVKVAKDNNEVLQTISKTYLEETGEIVLPEDVLYYQEYAGRKTYFEKEGIVAMKRLMEPGFNLLCFESLDSLQIKHHKKHASFIYPDESLIKGSSKLFTALLKKCLERRVMPIGWLTPRSNATPELVALLPQEEEVDSCKVQTTPPGFHIISVPFTEDVRGLVLENPSVKDEDLIEKAKQIIKKLQFKFNSVNFENPVLQTHWRNIEALALDLDKPEDLHDSTLPKEDKMEERAGILITEFLDESGINDLTSNIKNKRKFSAANNAPVNKAIKVDISVVKKEVEDGKLDKMTVSELKDFIVRNQLDIKTSGKKKADLKEEIKNYFC